VKEDKPRTQPKHKTEQPEPFVPCLSQKEPQLSAHYSSPHRDLPTKLAGAALVVVVLLGKAVGGAVLPVLLAFGVEGAVAAELCLRGFLR
jgi:hypothetical protein